ncbi:MAG: [protein-PII] uridylyltransferase [Rhodospirillales bacterium]
MPAPPAHIGRAKAAEQLRGAFTNGAADIRRRFEQGGLGARAAGRAQAQLTDAVIRAACSYAAKEGAKAEEAGDRLAVIGAGGYGRGLLSPHSDVDLMFLPGGALTPGVRGLIEFTLHALWDMGLKVGHAVRSMDDALAVAVADIPVRTSLLESRLIWGDAGLAQTFQDRFNEDIAARTGPAFTAAKLAERDARHARRGDARYVLEPNVKEGKGGLRDVQTLFWIAKYLYRAAGPEDLAAMGVLAPEDARALAKAEEFLCAVRAHLHYLTGRAEERLTFDMQPHIAARMGCTGRPGASAVERFMKRYFLTAKDVGDLTRVLCAVLEEQHNKTPRAHTGGRAREITVDAPGLAVTGGRLNAEGPAAFTETPVNMIRLFRESHVHGLDIHPEALRLVKRNLRVIDTALRADADANGYFMDILTSEKRNPEPALKAMNDAGVFGRFLPDFGRIVAQMQYDMYHVYTVDEHTIRAIGLLHRIERGELAEDHPYATRVVREVQSRRALYLAVLLHDIAKGRGGDHSETGAEIALETGPRLGLEPWETETVAWLVRHHLLMSRTAFKRDLDDPKTISDFAAAVQSPERLRLLLTLTVADIRAVGPGVWNAWKAALLRELYDHAQTALSGAAGQDRREQRIENARAALRGQLSDWPEDDIDAFAAQPPPGYWLAHSAETCARHARLLREAQGGPAAEVRLDAARGAAEITVCAPDYPGLFAAVSAAMSLSGADVVSARISTFSNGMAFDVFWAQDENGGPFAEPWRVQRLKSRIMRALAGEMRPAQELADARARAAAWPHRADAFTVAPRVLIDNSASAEHTVIEINGRDRPGLLSDLTALLTDLNLQTANAIVSTYGERAVDVFYVKDAFGLKVTSENKRDKIRAALLSALEPDGARAAAPAAFAACSG